MTKVKEYKNRHTLDDLIVKDYIILRAVPNTHLRTQIYGDKWKDITTQAQFLKVNGLSEKSKQILANLDKIKGIDEAIKKEIDKADKKLGRHVITIANLALIKLIKGGVKKKKERDINKRMVKRTVETMLPNEPAIEFAHKLFGGFKDKTEVSIIDETQKKWVDAARGLDEEAEEEQG